MLYDEFITGTKARDCKATFDQYETIEKIYNECEDMTKEDAYKLWKQTYGKQAKIDRKRLLKDIIAMSEYRDNDGLDFTAERLKIRNRLFQTGQSLLETNEWQMGYNSEITTPDGVTYKLEKYNEINFHRVARLIIFFENNRYETALIYLMSDLRISATA